MSDASHASVRSRRPDGRDAASPADSPARSARRTVRPSIRTSIRPDRSVICMS